MKPSAFACAPGAFPVPDSAVSLRQPCDYCSGSRVGVYYTNSGFFDDAGASPRGAASRTGCLQRARRLHSGLLLMHPVLPGLPWCWLTTQANAGTLPCPCSPQLERQEGVPNLRPARVPWEVQVADRVHGMHGG